MTEARLVPLYRGGMGQSPAMSAALWRDQGKVQQACELRKGAERKTSIRLELIRRTRKSPLAGKCVVGLEGLKPANKRL